MSLADWIFQKMHPPFIPAAVSSNGYIAMCKYNIKSYRNLNRAILFAIRTCQVDQRNNRPFVHYPISGMLTFTLMLLKDCVNIIWNCPIRYAIKWPSQHSAKSAHTATHRAGLWNGHIKLTSVILYIHSIPVSSFIGQREWKEMNEVLYPSKSSSIAIT